MEWKDVLRDPVLITKLKWPNITLNPNTTKDIIQEHPDVPWDKHGIYMNNNLCKNPEEVYLSDINTPYKFDLMLNPNTSWDFILKHASIDEMKSLSINKLTPVGVFQKLYPGNVVDSRFSFRMLAIENFDDIDFLLQKYLTSRSWYELSCNLTLSMDTVQKHPNIPWDWFALSRNPSVFRSLKTIEKYPNMPWDITGIARNINILPCDLESLEGWSFQDLSHNPNINDMTVESNISEDWDWENGLSDNPGLSLHFIEKYSSKMDWECLSYNPNLNWEFVKKNIDKKWSWSWLSHNRMKKHPYFQHRQRENERLVTSICFDQTTSLLYDIPHKQMILQFL
jgi:hypothetical protein